eukprot:3059171-Alexandrium_andersonii.AAC.1
MLTDPGNSIHRQSQVEPGFQLFLCGYFCVYRTGRCRNAKLPSWPFFACSTLPPLLQCRPIPTAPPVLLAAVLLLGLRIPRLPRLPPAPGFIELVLFVCVLLLLAPQDSRGGWGSICFRFNTHEGSSRGRALAPPPFVRRPPLVGGRARKGGWACAASALEAVCASISFLDSLSFVCWG